MELLKDLELFRIQNLRSNNILIMLIIRLSFVLNLIVDERMPILEGLYNWRWLVNYFWFISEVNTTFWLVYLFNYLKICLNWVQISGIRNVNPVSKKPFSTNCILLLHHFIKYVAISVCLFLIEAVKAFVMFQRNFSFQGFLKGWGSLSW